MAGKKVKAAGEPLPKTKRKTFEKALYELQVELTQLRTEKDFRRGLR